MSGPPERSTSHDGSARVESLAEPVAPPRADCVETRFGHVVRDPYRPLEVDDDRTLAWVAGENARCRLVLDRVKARSTVKDRLERLASILEVHCPAVATLADGTKRYFHLTRAPGAEQAALFVRDGLDGSDRIVLDPTRADPSGSLAIRAHHPSPCGTHVVVEMDRDGAESGELRLLDESGTLVSAPIARARNASVAWKPDSTGFYYACSFAPKPGVDPDAVYGRHIRLRSVRPPSGEDPVIFGADLEPTDYPSVELSPNGRWLVVTVFRSFSHSDLYLADASESPLCFRRLTAACCLHLPQVDDDAVFVLTDDGAPEFRVLCFSPASPDRGAWREIVRGEPSRVIERVLPLSDELLVISSCNGVASLRSIDRDGGSEAAVQLPASGAIDEVSGRGQEPEAFLRFEALDRPPAVLRVCGGHVQPWNGPTAPRPNSSDGDSKRPAEALRLTARSTDGTRVPYTVFRPPGAEPLPMVIYGYGGFGISLKPRHNAIARVLVEHGYGFVLAHVRGGGERGSAWHHAGAGQNKPNTFDDFIAVAEDVVGRGLASPSTLGAWGRSNGGLLVTAVMTRRPDLFQAVVAQVPLTDMIRYPEGGMGRLWLGEYGDPSQAEDFEALIGYSPYHHVRSGEAYPAALLTTAQSDARVPPWHARKLAAALREATTSGRAVLLRTEFGAGHGATNRLSKVLDEQVDVAAFFLSELGLGQTKPEREGL